jgi:GDP-L-fucose synthase
LDNPDNVDSRIKFIKLDLRDYNNCLTATKDQDIVFHVAGVKGSPTLTRDQPCSFFVPMLQFNTNVLEACRVNNVQWTLYTSTVGVYAPADVFYEDDMWKAPPSPNDKFAGYAKRMGELQLEGYKIQYPNFKSSIVRPVNIHGKWDNFNPRTSMVIPSLISKAVSSSKTGVPMTAWGDGSPVRDFISSYDVARAMIFCVENEIQEPVNVGSGTTTSIKDLIEIIKKYIPFEVEWDTTKPNGDLCRVANIDRLLSHGFKLEKTLDQSIKETIDWYWKNQEQINQRYEVFDE